ncbi:hypothetical protein PTB13_26670 [Bacillus sp. MHSD17]|nr:hypothetical protein [Bacillus sp. MHSD17]
MKAHSKKSEAKAVLGKTNVRSNSLAHRTTWLRSDLLNQKRRNQYEIRNRKALYSTVYRREYSRR